MDVTPMILQHNQCSISVQLLWFPQCWVVLHSTAAWYRTLEVFTNVTTFLENDLCVSAAHVSAAWPERARSSEETIICGSTFPQHLVPWGEESRLRSGAVPPPRVAIVRISHERFISTLQFAAPVITIQTHHLLSSTSV